MPQFLAGIAAEQEGRFENRVTREGTFDAWRVDAAAGLLLQVMVAADVVGVGMGVVNGVQAPALGVENLAHLAAGFFVAAAVDEADVPLAEINEAHLGRALDGVGVRRHLNQFVHGSSPFVVVMSGLGVPSQRMARRCRARVAMT